MNNKQLMSMCRYLLETPPAIILRVMLQAVLWTGPNQAIGLGYRDLGVDKGRKRRGKYLLKPRRIKGGRVEEKLNIDAQKRDDSRVPIEICDRRAWSYEGEKEIGYINVLMDSMLRWWRRKLTR